MKSVYKPIYLFFIGVCFHPHFALAEVIQDLPVHHTSTLLQNKSAIIPGVGYSHDSEQISPNVCYKVKINAKTGQEGFINLNAAISFDDLERQLHRSIRAKSGIGRFSASAEADYLRSIQDLDYSLSLNYSEILFNHVLLQLNGLGEEALTKQGKAIYTGTKKYFGLLCGDDYISAYQQGALLLMGINIRFSSHLDKEQFNTTFHGGFGNIIHAATEIQNYVKQYHLKGSIIMQAFQKGGNPSELSKVLSKDAAGFYYALSCDLQKMDDCVKAANGLLNYAAENFPKQISFSKDKEKGLVPLGEGFIRHDTVAEYRLMLAPSLVTKEVTANRNKLSALLEENLYYQQKLNELLFGYPVALARDSAVYKKALKLYAIVNNNIDTIVPPANPDDGALKCYSHPTLCHLVTKRIQNKLYEITQHDLNFLKPIAHVLDLRFWPQLGYWYPNDDSGCHFFASAAQFGYFDGTMDIGDDKISNIRLHVIMGPGNWSWIYLVGTLTKKNNNFFQGTLCYNGPNCLIYSAHVLANPFYFLSYKENADLMNG